MLMEIISSFDLAGIEFPLWDDVAGKTLPKFEHDVLDGLLICDIIDMCPDLELADRLASQAIQRYRRTNLWSKYWSMGQSARTPLGDLYVFADTFRGDMINTNRFRKFSYVKKEFAVPIAVQWWGTTREGGHASRNRRT